LAEEEMGNIMVDWEGDWKIPLEKTGPSTKLKPKIHEVDEEEEGGDGQRKGARGNN